MTSTFRTTRRPEHGPKKPPKRDGLLVEDFDDEDDDVHPLLDVLRDEYSDSIASSPPEPGVYPKGINDDAKSVWDDAVKKNKKAINKYDDVKKKWAAAVVVFQRAARDAGVKAFDSFPDKKMADASSKISSTINESYSNAIRDIEDSYQALRVDGYLQRLTKSEFDGASKHKGSYYIKSSRQALLRKNVDPDKVLKSLSGKSYKVGKKWAHKKIDNRSEILWEVSGDRVVVRSMISVTHDQALVLLGLEGGTKQSRVLQGMSKLGRVWFRTGKIDPTKISAYLLQRGHNDLAFSLARITGAWNV